MPKCILLKLQGLFAGSYKKKEFCLREYKRKTGVKNITHYEFFLLSNCIQLTSKSIMPFYASRFMSIIRFCIIVSSKSWNINKIFPGIGERKILQAMLISSKKQIILYKHVLNNFLSKNIGHIPITSIYSLLDSNIYCGIFVFLSYIV